MCRIGSLKGVRAQLYIIEFWLWLCWLLPVALEMTARRLLPPNDKWQVVTLVSGFLLNRLLLGAAHEGYYAVCRKLAATRRRRTSDTCEIYNLHTATGRDSMVRTFFAAYRHPLAACKRQLYWDAFRLLVYAAVLLPPLLLVAVGSDQVYTHAQALLAAAGAMFGIVGVFGARWLIRRLRIVFRLLVEPTSECSVWRKLWNVRGRTGEMMHIHARHFLLRLVPLSLEHFKLHADIALAYQKRLHKTKKRGNSQIFHTRVLGET